MNSSAPTIIRLVGSAGGVADAVAGSFTVVVRDIANNPTPGASVVVDISNCPDVTICANQLDPGAIVNLAAKTVRKFAGSDGQVTFTILGGSMGKGHGETPQTYSAVIGTARIFGNGTLLGSPTLATYDLDGSGGIGSGDLSVWLTDFASGTPYARSDFSGDGKLDASDACMLLTEFATGRSVQSCGAVSP